MTRTKVLIEALHSIMSFVTSTLSSTYFESVKDILYCDDQHSQRRKAVVSTLELVSPNHLLVMLSDLARLWGVSSR